jgi:signal transduction histidine kinase
MAIAMPSLDERAPDQASAPVGARQQAYLLKLARRHGLSQEELEAAIERPVWALNVTELCTALLAVQTCLDGETKGRVRNAEMRLRTATQVELIEELRGWAKLSRDLLDGMIARLTGVKGMALLASYADAREVIHCLCHLLELQNRDGACESR